MIWFFRVGVCLFICRCCGDSVCVYLFGLFVGSTSLLVSASVFFIFALSIF